MAQRNPASKSEMDFGANPFQIIMSSNHVPCLIHEDNDPTGRPLIKQNSLIILHNHTSSSTASDKVGMAKH